MKFLISKNKSCKLISRRYISLCKEAIKQFGLFIYAQISLKNDTFAQNFANINKYKS